ncbi:MAG: HAMP domain-containing protein [Thiobacillus sp.]|nr:HAMP domain-containing protein [Thiobacillus sp.]
MSSLRQKIILGYTAFAILLIGLSALYVLESRVIEKQVQAGASISEFFDVALEIRRFEKNYFLYHQDGDLEENRAFVARAKHLIDDNRQVFEQLSTEPKLTQLRRSLDSYDQGMSSYAQANSTGEARAIRELGLAIVNDAQALAAAERSALQRNLERQRALTLTTLVGLLGLLALAAAVVSGGIVRPLKEMERRMELVAAGSKDRLSMTAKDREIEALTRAFNHVLDEISLRQQQQLIQADRLASLGRLISGVAHEVNNPLSNISSSAQILLEDGEASAPEWRREMLGQIDSETVRAQRIVRSLLDYAREREFRRQPVALKAAIEETLPFLRNELPAQVAVRIDIPADLTLPADKPRLQQVFLNLLKNAAEALDSGGEILISARLREAGEAACARGQEQGASAPETVEIDVRDTGQGIPPEILGHIFEPFYTTKEASHGSGLGLFIVREIVEEHGGCISAESACGQYTVFHIRLPRPAGEFQEQA